MENSENDYPAFGMLMPKRHGSVDSYRYGFQGQEMDDEIKGEGNSINYKYRMHDPRVGRFYAVDPLAREYPYYSPYSFSGNQIIHTPELEGLEPGKDLNYNLSPDIIRTREKLGVLGTPEDKKLKKAFEDGKTKGLIYGGAGVGAAFLIIESGGTAIPALQTLFWRGAFEITKRQALIVATGNFAIGFFDEGNQIQTPGPIDDFGRGTRLVIGNFSKSKLIPNFSIKVPKLDFMLGKLSQSNLAKDTKQQITNIAKSIFRGDKLKAGGIDTKEKLLGLAQDAFSNGELVEEVSTEAGQVIKKQVSLNNGTKVNFSFLTREGEELSELTTITIDGQNKQMKEFISEMFDKAKDLGNDLKK
ncbi:RHS repeat-associated core domain-containing protein [Mangrovimonas cancribranchiae]|uniref:RHS repeat-associated core domain-containing protein n=1 Tax=Mangrovimonas cancribranchiae TaxID=3080055 RepID=A0AAU6P308_9FLAO